MSYEDDGPPPRLPPSPAEWAALKAERDRLREAAMAVLDQADAMFQRLCEQGAAVVRDPVTEALRAALRPSADAQPQKVAAHDLLKDAGEWLHACAPLHARAPEIRALADTIFAYLKEKGAFPNPCEVCGRPTGGCCTVPRNTREGREPK